jgi:hypothetical protein
VVGVVVVDRRPLDVAPEIALDALHQLPDVVGEVEIARVFRRHDEPELVALAEARLLEGLARRAARGTVEHTRRAVLLHAVALDVPKVSGSRLGAVASEHVHVRFDDDPTGILPRTEAGGRGKARRPAATKAPMPSAHARRDAKGARGDAFARAIGPAEPRAEFVALVVVELGAVAHRKTSLLPMGSGGIQPHIEPPKGPKISPDIQPILEIRGPPFILPSAFAPGSQTATSVSNACLRGTAVCDHQGARR